MLRVLPGQRGCIRFRVFVRSASAWASRNQAKVDVRVGLRIIARNCACLFAVREDERTLSRDCKRTPTSDHQTTERTKTAFVQHVPRCTYHEFQEEAELNKMPLQSGRFFLLTKSVRKLSFDWHGFLEDSED